MQERARKARVVDRSIGRERRQAAFLEQIRQGATVPEACGVVGVTRSTYETWRKRHPTFRMNMDAARLGNLHELDVGWQGDFTSFRLSFFGMDTYWHQAEIVRAIETAQPGEVVMVLIPPEFGKTTVLEDYANFKLATDPNHRITTLSERMQHARKMIGRVQLRMTDSTVAPEYVGKFGPFYVPGQNQTKPWTSDYFSVFKRNADERDFSMESRGWNGAIAGLRTDLLVPDDIQSRKSLSQSKKIVEVIRQDVLTRARRGIVVFIGTRVGDGDVYDLLIDEGVVDNLVCLPATDGDGHSLCPEMWSDEQLVKTRAKVGESVWWRNYQQRPQDATNVTFPSALIDGLFDIGLGLDGPFLTDRVCSLDPALVNWSGLNTWAYDFEKMQLMDCARTHNVARTEDLILLIERQAIKHHFQHLVLEGGGNQRGLVNDERLREISRRYGFYIVEHITGSNRNQAEILGVARMPSSMLKKEIVLPGKDEDSRKMSEVLVNQWRTWRPDVDPRKHRMDEAMAAWFAWMFWQNRRMHLNPNPSKLKASGLPFRPLKLPALGRR